MRTGGILVCVGGGENSFRGTDVNMVNNSLGLMDLKFGKL